MTKSGLAHFTPSMNDPLLLEAVFTARGSLANQLLDRIRDSTSGETRHYSLIVGPRGIGKTHLVSLIYYRVTKDDFLKNKLRIAWLLEDPWRINSYALLLSEILNQLNREYGVSELPSKLEKISDMTDSERQSALEHTLSSFLEKRVLLLIVENLDEIFNALGDSGQKRLRAYIQNTGSVTILATSTSLLPDISDREKAFYGFFKQYTLQPFSLNECIEVLVRISKYCGDQRLVDRLQSSIGKARVRAIHHIAGGNPRIYVIFHQFLTHETLDELASPFMKLVQELTPYYQSRMQTLSPQQRTIVDIIRRCEGPIAVKEIAKLGFSTSQSVSKDLQKLRDLGYVESNKLGRESLYELREPLMRICLSAKEQRGGTIPLFVEFLRIWFTRQELERLEAAANTRSSESSYYEEAIKTSNEREHLAARFERQKIQACLEDGDEDLAVAYLERMIDASPEDRWAWSEFSRILVSKRQLSVLIERLRLHLEDFSDDAQSWNAISYYYHLARKSNEACTASKRAVELEPENPIFAGNLLISLQTLGLQARSNELSERCLLIQGDTPAHWYLRGLAFENLDKKKDAAAAYSNSIKLKPHDYVSWRSLLFLLERIGSAPSARLLSTFAVEILPENVNVWIDYSMRLGRDGRDAEALEAIDKAITIEPENTEAKLKKAFVLIWLGRIQEADEIAKVLISMEGRDFVALLSLRLALIRGSIDEARSLLRYCIDLGSRDFESLPSPTHVVIRTQNANIWQRYIDIWLEIFRENGTLESLGSLLLRDLLDWNHLWPTIEVASAWLETWRKSSVDFPEFQLSIRLMSAAVEFLGSGNRDVLLALPVEQRTLLEPEMERYLRARGVLKDEVDRTIEDLIVQVRTRIVLPEYATKSPLTSQSHVDGEAVARALGQYGERDFDRPLAHLLPDEWSSHTREEAQILLERIVNEDSFFRAAFSNEAIRITRLERRGFMFSKWHLYQMNLRLNSRVGAIDFVSDGRKVTVLDGSNGSLLAFLTKEHIALGNDSDMEYISLFTSGLRAEEGRFALVDPTDETAMGVIRNMGFAPETPYINPRLTVGAEGERAYQAHIIYGDVLFEVGLKISGKVVEMLYDKILIRNLGLRKENYEGPIRFWANSPGEKPRSAYPSAQS